MNRNGQSCWILEHHLHLGCTIGVSNIVPCYICVSQERLYFAALPKLPPSHNILAGLPRRTKDSEKKQINFFCIDNELVYWNFFLDFGPLNLGQLMRFSRKLNDKLRKFPAVCFYSSIDPAKRTNAIYLITAWQMLYLDRTPEQAFHGFTGTSAKELPNSSWPPISKSQGSVTIAELPDFHDASPCYCDYDLQVTDCLRALQKAVKFGFFNKDDFDVEEYEYFEQVENGDLNWIVQGQILAFAGPSYERHVSPEGYCTLAPADYIPYFQQSNIGLVVRLNKKFYNEQDFIDAGIDHVEAFFVDGSCPTMEILRGVIDAFEQTVRQKKGFAVHCKAGLGRTGTCIGAFLMKHYGMTAKEVIAWMRMCRPGMVIGPQQQYLQKIQKIMWEEGVKAGCLDKMPDEQPGSASSTNDDIPMTTTNDQEAITGRAGQAEGLRAARANRSTSGGSSTPVTPESREKAAVTVTPERGTAVASRLWCG
jgi:cell division cycle 14